MFRILVALVCAATALHAADDLDSQLKTILTAYAIMERNAADPVSSEKAFFEGAIPGLLRRLDPHSVFFDPGQFEQVKKMEESTQKGFGSVVSLLPGRVIVLQTTPGTPSARSGLNPGDEIVAINGYDISRLDLDQLTQLLSQSRQQQAQLIVRRPGVVRMLSFTLIPEEMQASSVERAFFIGAGMGYIRVASFDANTAGEIKKAIEKLGGDRLAGLVLDLRNNPGGMVKAALDTASLFLQPGTKIVTVRGRHVPEESETVPSIATPYGFKLAILVNEKTASASEIVSGAMQDHDRATILGEASYGKGLVQSVFPLTDGTGLALTTALYYTPSGRSIQKPLDSSKFELGDTTAHPNVQTEFHTDKGRLVTGGGGIRPDIEVSPPAMNRLRAVLDASGSFTNFATEYLRKNKISEDFDVTPAVLRDFQLFLADRGIQPGVAELSVERSYMTNRLKTEIFNQAFGVEKGDEVEAQRDPVILKALEIVGS
ncbi:MAG TPA: S41 family peptidase [Bryobacteraceae bacterium]|nr:S41 family peptidase [Bryobacteraceae bacterium]